MEESSSRDIEISADEETSSSSGYQNRYTTNTEDLVIDQHGEVAADEIIQQIMDRIEDEIDNKLEEGAEPPFNSTDNMENLPEDILSAYLLLELSALWTQKYG